MENRIVMARKYAGLSQKELALKMKISPSTLNGYEKGNHDPKSPGLTAISQICNVTVDYLLGLTDIPNQDLASSPLSSKEKELITDFRKLNSQGQDYIFQTMDMVKDKYKKCNTLSELEDLG